MVTKKEFVSPKPIGNELMRPTEQQFRNVSNVSPILLPQITATLVDSPHDNHQNGQLRRRSSHIIGSGDQSFNQAEGFPLGRDRQDSITAFKKFEKHILMSNEMGPATAPGQN